MVKIRLLSVLAGAFLSGSSLAQELSEADFLADLPTVLTSSRLSQPQMDAPNSITVIDRKLIEASGYHTLSDLFRLVPGLYVGQEKGWFHNVSHGLADSYSRRMQVMVDGRSIYLPSFGGVRWDTLPLSIDDIERIEVVRGPNAASFGANAMTGIIHIITRHPEDVAGRRLRFAAGDHHHGEAWFSWAGSAEGGSHRVTLGRRQDGGFANQDDDERSNILNYRGDIDLDPRQRVSLQFGLLAGDRGAGQAGEPANLPHDQDVASRYFQADYRLELDSGNSVQAKLYFNHLKTSEDIPTVYVPGSYYKSDLLNQRWHAELQLDSQLGQGLRSAIGAYLRRDSVQSLYYWNTEKKLRADSWGVFGHMEWRLSESWLVNAGAFWEDYEPVGGRFSPRATVHWQPSPRHGFRAGISKAYRNPVLFETSADNRIHLLAADGSSLIDLLPFIRASGNVNPEKILSREIGYLGQWPAQGLSLDLRVFRERIEDYISAECPTGTTKDCSPKTPPKPFVARDFYNMSDITQQGFEAQWKWRATPQTQFIANYALLDIDSGIDEKRYSPSQQYGVHVMHQFPGGIDLMLSHYWVPAFKPIGQGDLSAYKRLDARIAKRFKLDGMRGDIALTWQNLTGNYVDFADDTVFKGGPYTNLFDTRAYVQFRLDF
jgi:iron complex outermembrane receptor protein